MKEKTLHMIGNAHIDPVWLWQWPEGLHEVKATFRSALDRMNEYDDFVFVSSSAVFYEWVEKSDPEMFEEIRKRVVEGRWQVVGGWWIQSDCNLPGGESFVRQALYGQRYFKEKFGVTATVGYNVDSFGHNGMLPQLLKKSGLDYYVFLRPMPHEKGLPGRLFWWESDDGARVLAFRIPYEYCNWAHGLERHVLRCAAEIRLPFTEGLCFYGVGNHGGGPTKENLESIRKMSADPEFPTVIFSTPERLFKNIQADGLPIPVVHDDLQHHASGCYAAHSGVKQWNRRAENLLVTAEKFAAIAEWTTGQPYPVDIGQAWKNVLFNQFHDILAGTSVEEAYEDARDLYGEARSIAGRALAFATQSLAWNISFEAAEGVTPVVLFNPHAWTSRVNVEVELGQLREGDTLADDFDRPVAMQMVRSRASANGRSRLSFIAELPPLGYRTYKIRPGDYQVQPDKLNAGENFLENERFRLAIDPESGTIASLYDRVYNLEVFAGPAAVPVVLEDSSDTWGHNVFQFNQLSGKFTPKKIRLVENGPVKAVLRVTYEFGSSNLIQDFTMYRNLDQIDVLVQLDWREHFKVLKLRFPVNISHMRPVYEIPYGHKERFANGEEEPGQSWIDLSGLSKDTGALYGLSILNDGKYSFDVNVRDIGLTVLRSPIYAHHMPVVPEPENDYDYLDQGPQRFRYTILPHLGSWETAGVVQRAAELNQSPVVVTGTSRPGGILPQSLSFLSVDRENIVVSVVKKSEEGDDLIVRCVETWKEATRARLCFPLWKRVVEADFGPCEIKTFRIPRDPDKPAVETNLIEW